MNSEEVRQSETAGTKLEPFIITYTGKKFYYDPIDAADIDIRDIAHSLSQLCRYTGHTNGFYSVAQHSLLVAQKMPGNEEAKLAALLHDAAEAYTNDLASPLKSYLRRMDNLEYMELQHEITAAVYRAFGIMELPEDLRLYDLAACVYEAEGHLGLSVNELEMYGFPMELRDLWHPWDPKEYAGKSADQEMEEVEVQFIRRFEALMHAVGRSELI
jgi:5'-deoxynucleotidase YfbR-like HD superfamily hydrolase